MPGVRKRGKEIRDFIIENIYRNPSIAAQTAKEFGISLPAVYKHIDRLAQDKVIVKSDVGYLLLPSNDYRYTYKITDDLSEDSIWEQDIKQHFISYPENVKRIAVYAFLEIFNNAIDHSKGSEIVVWIYVYPTYITVSINDNGIGIFKNIQDKFGLLNRKDALLELSKGKRTTDKSRHSGQGIFFVSKAVDGFAIVSDNTMFVPMKEGNYHEPADSRQFATSVFMQIKNNSKKELKKVFDEFSTETPGDFDKTMVPIKLANSEDLVSRSQARRVLAGLELFKEVTMDFTDIKYIGQAFADEIFRVFVNTNPSTKIIEANTNSDVQSMINRARNTKL